MRKQSDATKLKHLKRKLKLLQKDRDDWKLSAETWKKTWEEMVEATFKARGDE